MSVTVTAVKHRTRHTYTIEIEDEDGESCALETTFDTDNGHEPIIEKLPGGGWAVGYIVHDDDCESPLESCDAEGQIFTCHRSSRTLAQYEENVSDRPVLGWQVSPGGRLYVRPNCVLLDVYDHSDQVYAISGSAQARNWPDQRWDVAHGGAVWVPDKYALENIQCNVDQHLLPEGVAEVCYESHHHPDGTCITRPWQEGDPECYKANGVPDELHTNLIVAKIDPRAAIAQKLKFHTRQHGFEMRDWLFLERQRLVPVFTRGYKDFKTAYEALFKFLGIKPDKEQRKQAFRTALLKYVESVLVPFNEWLSGDCWSWSVDVLDAEGQIIDNDACWGIIGSKWALEEAASNVKYQVKRASEKAVGA